jgi:hypothetical protein
MALILLDSFDTYATADLPDVYPGAQSSLRVDPSGRRGSNGLRSIDTDDPNAHYLLPIVFPEPIQAGTEPGYSGYCVVGFAMNWPAYASGGDLIYVWSTTGSDGAPASNQLPPVTIQVNNEGRFMIYTNNQYGVSPILVRFGSGWHYYEFKFTLAAANNNGAYTSTDNMKGFLDVRIDNVLVHQTGLLDYTHINRYPFGTDRIGYLQLRVPVGAVIDDLYVLDSRDLGGGDYTDFLGEQVIVPLPPNGAGARTEWTAYPTGPNWATVDEIPPDDSEGVSATDAGDTDLYTLENLPITPASVTAVGVRVRAKKLDYGARFLSTAVRTGGTEYVYSGAIMLGTEFASYQQCYPRNPVTAASWTATEIDNLEAGVTIVPTP